jgi:bifunctional non-homologous end joining protein LigD
MKPEKLKRFVIQRHEREGETVHWDLMLEQNKLLETYRVNTPPEEWVNRTIEAEKIFDHPLKFLTYEGSVNKGKGNVKIADSGNYRILSKKENLLSIDFAGRIIKGKKEIIFAGEGSRARRG